MLCMSFADVNLFHAYRIIKTYFEAVLLLWGLFFFLHDCINKQVEQHGSVRKNTICGTNLICLFLNYIFLSVLTSVNKHFSLIHAWCMCWVQGSVHQEGLKENQEAAKTLTVWYQLRVTHVFNKAGSDRKDFMKLAGCLASHKVWVCVGQITVCVVCTLAFSWKVGWGKQKRSWNFAEKPLF